MNDKNNDKRENVWRVSKQNWTMESKNVWTKLKHMTSKLADSEFLKPSKIFSYYAHLNHEFQNNLLITSVLLHYDLKFPKMLSSWKKAIATYIISPSLSGSAEQGLHKSRNREDE